MDESYQTMPEPPVAPVEEKESSLDPWIKPFVEYDNAKGRIKNLLSAWSPEIAKAQTRRVVRYVDIDAEAEKRVGTLDIDEVYLPYRLVDTNIRREATSYVTYIVKAPRQCVLKNKTSPEAQTDILEKDFTDKCRYNGWEIPFFSAIDGMQTHGWDAFEVVYDAEMPGKFRVEQVGHENLIFSVESESLDANEFIIRKYRLTKMQVIEYVRNGRFDQKQAVQLLSGEFGGDKQDGTAEVEKIFFKDVAGKVYVAWSYNKTCSDWLGLPRPLNLGITAETSEVDPLSGQTTVNQVPIQPDFYPIVILPYLISENKKLTSIKGRVYLDQYMQDAVTSLMTSYATAMRRAAHPYFSADADEGELQQLQVKLQPLSVFPKELTAWSLPVPPAAILQAVNAMVTQNSQENATINYAALNRQDSEKTATEITAAQQEATLMSAIQVALFGSALRRLYDICFDIYRSGVLGGIVKTSYNPQDFFGQGQSYTIRPAGDIDVVERMEKLQKMMTAWPIVSQTGAKFAFLSDILSMMFPEDAARYIQAMQQDDLKGQLLVHSAQLLQTAITDQSTGQLKPEFQPHAAELQQLAAQVQQVMQPNQSPMQQGT